MVVCLTSFTAHMICLSVKQDHEWSSYVLWKGRTTEGFKREPTDPHKQALSFMASVTPSLLKPDSQTFKHYWSAPLPAFPPNQIFTKKLVSFSHTILPIQKSSLLYPPLSFKKIYIYCLPYTPPTVRIAYVSTDTYYIYTRTCIHKHAVSFLQTHTNTLGERERGGQHNSSVKNAEEVYVAIGKGERHLVWAQMSNYPFAHRDKKKAFFLGTCLPPIFLLAAAGVQ